jgi:hypothetical protein
MHTIPQHKKNFLQIRTKQTPSCQAHILCLIPALLVKYSFSTSSTDSPLLIPLKAFLVAESWTTFIFSWNVQKVDFSSPLWLSNIVSLVDLEKMRDINWKSDRLRCQASQSVLAMMSKGFSKLYMRLSSPK